MNSNPVAFLTSLGINFNHPFKTTCLTKITARRPRLAYFPNLPHRKLHSVEAPTMMAPQNSRETVDHYKMLDIPETADQQVIKRAYRRAALKNHPDVSDAPDARERFLKIQEAYSVLSDESKRATYDRMRRSGQTSSPFGDSSGSGFGGFGTDGGATEFARRWSENNPMPKDINDNFGNIFSDLFSGVADAVGGTAARSGVVDDFIDFLERRVDTDSSSSSRRRDKDKSTSNQTDDSLEEILRSKDEDVLRAELDDARFIIDQLRQRRRKAQNQEDELRERIGQWQDRADRADRSRDYDTRDAARERADDLVEEALRFEKRVNETNVHIKKQENRLRRIEERLRQIQDSSSTSTSTSTSSSQSPGSGVKQSKQPSKSTSKKSTQSTAVNQEEAIDQELERMKRELGL